MNYWFRKRNLRFLWLTLASLILSFNFTVVHAANLSQGYQADGTLVVGNIVSTSGNSNTQVQIASTDNINNLLGVVVSANNTLVNVDANSSSVSVANSGITNSFVDDINGSIKKGDPVTISPINGVGMKATQPTRIIGIAQADFSTATELQTKQITDKAGQVKQVQVGLLPVLVAVGDYQSGGYTGSAAVVHGVQSVVSSLAGRSISSVRAMVAFGVITLAIILAIIVLYASVTGSIRSIGRNPLAKKSVLRSLAQVILAVSLIIIAAIAAVYVIVVT